MWRHGKFLVFDLGSQRLVLNPMLGGRLHWSVVGEKPPPAVPNTKARRTPLRIPSGQPGANSQLKPGDRPSSFASSAVVARTVPAANCTRSSCWRTFQEIVPRLKPKPPRKI